MLAQYITGNNDESDSMWKTSGPITHKSSNFEGREWDEPTDPITWQVVLRISGGGMKGEGSLYKIWTQNIK